jgi:tRNA dimethylallyltransferase
MPRTLIVILGPTASGKTSIAARLAKEMGTEVISADSRQVYRGMDIGTGKDRQVYTVDGVDVPYHLVDIVDPSYEFNVFEYQRLFFRCYREMRARRLVPILCGGSGLYLESVLLNYRMTAVPDNPHAREELEALDTDTLRALLFALHPAVHNTTDLHDRRRLIRAITISRASSPDTETPETSGEGVDALVIGIRRERGELRRRITERLQARLADGLLDEVKGLHDAGITWEKLDFFGLEYRYAGRCLRGGIGEEEMVTLLTTKIHQFAKRQETWFRRMERRGIDIHWVDGADYEAVRETVRRSFP